MIAGIQTHGERLNVHPHTHARMTCGAFTEAGAFIPLTAFDADALLHAWGRVGLLAQGANALRITIGFRDNLMTTFARISAPGAATQRTTAVPIKELARTGNARNAQKLTRADNAAHELAEITTKVVNWWRRRESNPRPRIHQTRPLRA
jgi:hypothetical protein